MSTSRLDPNSTVCALIPHYECEPWLAQAIESLLDQSRPPDAIAVIDDASAEPPTDVIDSYPVVTLLSAPDNGGPYRLIQTVIRDSDFDAYLFQDADDWSAPDRLQVLLDAAERTGAELVGSHEVRVRLDGGDVVPVRYPLDVNAVLEERPAAFPLLHPTSLVGRDLVTRIGGFATGMRFSGDAEFLRRAAHAGTVVNADYFGYFRRKRAGSLTTDPATALQSDARRRVQEVLADRARRNAELSRRGEKPDLRPWRLAAPVQLRHLNGPALRAGNIEPVRRRRAAPGSTSGPVFVVGAPRSGQNLLAWGLGQHPNLRALEDSRWLARAAADVEGRASEEAVCTPAGFREEMARSLAALLDRDAFGRRSIAAGIEVGGAAHALARLFSDARFVHVLRSPEEAISSLIEAPTEGGTFYTPDSAARAWMAGVDEALLLEEALGSDRVLRISYHDLAAGTEDSLRRCLSFLGESYDPACLRPFTGLESGSSPAPSNAKASVSPPVRAAVDRLAARTAGAGPGDSQETSAKLLARRFRSRVSGVAGPGHSVVERLRLLVAQSTPEGAVAAVVSKGDPRLIELAGRTGWHLPQAAGGDYAGFHPADSIDAVRHLERLQQEGAQYLVVPATSLWWLSFYTGLTLHLARRASLVSFHEEVGAVYRLEVAPPAPSDGKPASPEFYALPPAVLDLEEVLP